MFALSALHRSHFNRLIGRNTAVAKAPLDLQALVGTEGWNRLPLAVQHRFAVAHADVVYTGQMDLRCSRVGRVYALLARAVGGPLTHLSRDAIPTTVKVSGNGHGGVVWERCFHTGSGEEDSQEHVIRSTKELDADGDLLERTDGGLSMSLDVFEEGGTLVFRSHRFWLLLGTLRLRIPALLTPGTCRVVHTDLGEGLFRFTLSMVHPLWGETFHQSGVFADPDLSSSTESTS